MRSAMEGDAKAAFRIPAALFTIPFAREVASSHRCISPADANSTLVLDTTGKNTRFPTGELFFRETPNLQHDLQIIP